MSGAASTKAPNQTLYVRNLPSKVKKLELKRQLFGLFVIYGKVLDVVATRRDGMREQAFVVFQDLASSTAALRALDGFMFYGKPLAIDYALEKSKATIVAERGPEALFDPNYGMKSAKGKATYSSAGANLQGRERKRAREEAGERAVSDSEEEHEEEDRSTSLANGDGPPLEKKRKADENGAQSSDEEEMEMADSDSDADS